MLEVFIKIRFTLFAMYFNWFWLIVAKKLEVKTDCAFLSILIYQVFFKCSHYYFKPKSIERYATCILRYTEFRFAQ